MTITIIGTIARTGEEKTFGGGFRKREIVIHEGGDARKPLPVEFTARDGGADRIAQTLALTPGTLVRCDADLSGHEWEGRTFLSLRGFAIRAATFEEPPLPSDGAEAAAPAGEPEELPF